MIIINIAINVFIWQNRPKIITIPCKNWTSISTRNNIIHLVVNYPDIKVSTGLFGLTASVLLSHLIYDNQKHFHLNWEPVSIPKDNFSFNNHEKL